MKKVNKKKKKKQYHKVSLNSFVFSSTAATNYYKEKE
jgi:hypothetical protein